MKNNDDLEFLTKSLLSDIEDLEDLETKNLGKIMGMFARGGESVKNEIGKIRNFKNERNKLLQDRKEAADLRKARAQTRFNKLTDGVAKRDAVTPAQQRAYNQQLAEREKMKQALRDPLVSNDEKAIYKKRLAQSINEPVGRERSKAELMAYGAQNQLNNWAKNTKLGKWVDQTKKNRANKKADRAAARMQQQLEKEFAKEWQPAIDEQNRQAAEAEAARKASGNVQTYTGPSMWDTVNPGKTNPTTPATQTNDQVNNETVDETEAKTASIISYINSRVEFYKNN